jgi:hypothetical protein
MANLWTILRAGRRRDVRSQRSRATAATLARVPGANPGSTLGGLIRAGSQFAADRTKGCAEAVPTNAKAAIAATAINAAISAYSTAVTPRRFSITA